MITTNNLRNVVSIQNIDLDVYTNKATLNAVLLGEDGVSIELAIVVDITDLVRFFNPDTQDNNVLKVLGSMPNEWWVEPCLKLT